MTELLNHPATPPNATSTPTTTSTATAAAPSLRLLAGSDRAKTPARLARASRSGTIDTEQLTAWVESQQESDDSAADDEPLTPVVLASLSIRRLRMLVNQAYTLMDTDYPPSRTVDRYEMLVDELERRAEAAEKRHPVNATREKFRDNSLSCRFELFTDGHLVAYMQYRMTGGNLTLILGNELPGFRDQGAATTLMRNIVLDAHKRRLNLIPRCQMASTFLADHPQYQQYTSRH
ncbi:N-acetyltransferase (plasmid) [Arthrobacter agilis]|uniref:GNAT family N-acetyltransferase n=1 Tax=Arthrobacter agilis TaxID=37921 RepID=UPI0023652C29|nr:N-acetyltransferase [Arthrobacter agilis]WDF35127.1 N-acetyltransferase [Arthrobacter agilis]